MATLNSQNWDQLLEPGLRKLFEDAYRQLQPVMEVLFSVQKSQKAVEHDLGVGMLGEVPQFAGQVQYGDIVQGFKKDYVHQEFALGIKIQRTLVDDDLYNIINRLPQALAISASRRREKDGASVFNNGFTTVNTGGDGLSLYSSAHTNASGASTSTQSNAGVLALTPANVESTRQSMKLFKDDRDQLIDVNPDLLLVPRALELSAFEIINSRGKVDTANNNVNFFFGKYKLQVWDYLTDSNNWFFMDTQYMKMFLLWFDRVAPEFNRDRDFDTLVAKFMTYFRHSFGWSDWRFTFGHNVA